MLSVAVVTTVAGRQRHLARQVAGLIAQEQPADNVVIVRMDDSEIELPEAGASRWITVDVPVTGPLPLAAARNAGAAAAETDVIVLLDVDCIPGRGLVRAYAAAADRTDGLICGVVRYLPAGEPAAGAEWTESDLLIASEPHPARPTLKAGQLVREDRHELAWTTSLAMRRETFVRIGGFDERYVGYGGEDTDFAFRARELGIGVWWTGDAIAYHQHHNSQRPPVEHLEDIVRNASLFAARHGWYPMQGWLEQFMQLGLVDFRPEAGVLRPLAPRVPPS